jgi:hypothetical protein
MDRNTIFLGGIIAFIILIVVIAVWLNIRKNRQLTILWQQYNAAKASGDKQKALNAGRAYYSRRRGRPTIYDEQAIANDLSTMK